MQAACLVAEYSSREDAKVAIEVLRKFDFHADAISVVWKGHESKLGSVERDAGGDQVGVEQSVGAGAAIAAMVGTPLGIGSVMGPIMVAGPLVAVIGGAAAGGVLKEANPDAARQSDSDRVDTRGLFAMANHYGLHAHDASTYEQRVQQGTVLVIVTSTPPRLDEAQSALRTTREVSLQRFARHAAE